MDKNKNMHLFDCVRFWGQISHEGVGLDYGLTYWKVDYIKMLFYLNLSFFYKYPTISVTYSMCWTRDSYIRRSTFRDQSW